MPGERKMSINTFKIRDDHQPLKSTAEVDAFRLRDGSQAAWLAGETFGNEELRKRIEPWLTSLLQSELEVDCGLPAVDRYHAILGFREQR